MIGRLLLVAYLLGLCGYAAWFCRLVHVQPRWIAAVIHVAARRFDLPRREVVALALLAHTIGWPLAAAIPAIRKDQP
jgi:hypothetical protein